MAGFGVFLAFFWPPFAQEQKDENRQSKGRNLFSWFQMTLSPADETWLPLYLTLHALENTRFCCILV
jgi:hypothetical protein